ncbi:ATP-binding protein [Nocardioides terrisoli]|uniref:ATP-binding protein n=1 Tax=Nocardioides terrisoli TaxID=3388267 RepID=UPI00287BBA82|nr:biotin carboxylase N-terminal domain-containing protein [Nocardioides marmorisolisilvae]
MTTINRLLVANRGEIARRVFATCRRLGIQTVAVHSDADADLPFVAEADVAVRLPGSTPAATYLRPDLVLDAARRTGADAIHPGYGFLSENADFARAVIEAGLTWIGPAPEAIEQMGSKVESKKLMAAAGVPVLDNVDPDTVAETDLPLLVKASAGGGGRGMRVVRTLAALPDEVAAARAEAESAFGDGTVFVEPYVERGRHVEVQVVGSPATDTGTSEVLVLGTRDCSLQRRHQKVVEEAPAPGLSDEVRAAMHEAGRAAAAAVGYVGAGTVEFLYDPATERFFFLEMNTRLQVEHPVTEEVYDVDLVELQLAVAEGGPLPLPEEPTGHAIEARLYAEDPAADHQPQSGRLATFEFPDVDTTFDQLDGPGIRLDAGFVTGNEVGTHYDAMLAKVICWAPTREQAARRLAGVLRRARLHGVTTNRDQLVRLLGDAEFVAGSMTTALMGERDWSANQVDPQAATAAALALAEHDRARARVQRRIPVGWRNVTSQPQLTRFEGGVEVAWLGARNGYLLDDAEVVSAAADRVVLAVDGVASPYDVQVVDVDGASPRVVHVDGPTGAVSFRELPRFVDPADQVAEGSLLAPMPGTVVAVPVESGATVVAGDTVLVLEAMKMQHTIRAPGGGVVTVEVVEGQQVSAGDVLAVVEEDA